MENNINQCRECCRDISEEDSKKYKGYCKSCYKDLEESKYQKEASRNIQNNYNNVARIIKAISIIACIIGILGSLIMFSEYLITGGLAFSIIIGSIITSVFFYGYGEIIQLLEDIKNK